MRTYQFDELSKVAQSKAVDDYIKGWEETHPKGDLKTVNAYMILMGMNDQYTKDGELVDECY